MAGRVAIEAGWIRLEQLLEALADEEARRAHALLDPLGEATPGLRDSAMTLALLDAELSLVDGDDARAEELLEEARRLGGTAASKEASERQLQWFDTALSIASARGDGPRIVALAGEIEQVIGRTLLAHGGFEGARARALQLVANLVGSLTPIGRTDLARQIGYDFLEDWSRRASAEESPTIHAILRLNLGALEQAEGHLDEADRRFEEAEEILELARRGGRSDRWVEAVQMSVLINLGVTASLRGRADRAEELLTRGHHLACDLTDRTDLDAHWQREAFAAQELANVHMDSSRADFSVAVLEASLERIASLEERRPLPSDLASERDWQCYSLVTQLLRTGATTRAVEVLRAVLDRGTHDPELAVALANLSAWAVRQEEPQAASDRDLARSWLERADDLAPGFAASIDRSSQPWSRVPDRD